MGKEAEEEPVKWGHKLRIPCGLRDLTYKLQIENRCKFKCNSGSQTLRLVQNFLETLPSVSQLPSPWIYYTHAEKLCLHLPDRSEISPCRTYDWRNWQLATSPSCSPKAVCSGRWSWRHTRMRHQDFVHHLHYFTCIIMYHIKKPEIQHYNVIQHYYFQVTIFTTPEKTYAICQSAGFTTYCRLLANQIVGSSYLHVT
jgi:hypothetical protein